jgi:hypothetical protein
MSIISLINYENSSDEIKREYDLQVKENGNVTNMKRTLLHSLTAFKAYQEWYPLRDEIQKFIGDRGVIIFSHAISSENECLLCSTYFRKILIERGENPEELKFNEKEQLLVDFGRQIVKAPNQISKELYEKLKNHFSESELVLLTGFAGIMIATNVVNSVLKVDLDDYLENFKK